MALRSGAARVGNAQGATTLLEAISPGREALPNLYRVSAPRWLTDNSLHEEVFGPLGIVVEAADVEEMIKVAAALQGQLTCTILTDEGDAGTAKILMPVIERTAGCSERRNFPKRPLVSSAAKVSLASIL